MKKIKLLSIVLFLFVSSVGFSQENKPTTITDGFALEVMQTKARPFVYQRIGGWTWYDGFQRTPDYKVPAGTRPVEAVKLYPREEAGVVKVKVTVLRGPNLEYEDLVSEYTVGMEKVVINDLSKFGVMPFEIGLVRAPSTVAYMPKINNNLKSMLVSVEPLVATLPSYKLRVLNISSKPIAGFSYNTFLDGRQRYTGMPQQLDGTPLILPGSAYEKVFPYALNTSTQSTGEVPPPIEGLQLNILGVFFMDGTYEGSRSDAARFRAFKLGEKIQLTRILELLRSKSAASWETLAPKVDELSYRVASSEVTPLLAEFQGLSDREAEGLRSNGELSASRIEKDFASTFGTGKKIDASVFAAAVSAAINKCQKWLDSLP